MHRWVMRGVWMAIGLLLGSGTWAGAGRVERGPWCGAVTTNSAVVKAKLSRVGAVGRLVVSKSVDGGQPFFSETATASTNQNRVVTFRLANLQADTFYFYGIQVDGQMEPAKRGRFRTFPSGPASFTFAFGSCARTASTHPVFGTILKNNPLFFLHTGDFHYLDLATNDPARFRAAYDLVLSSRPQVELYRMIPLMYMWDDHDFAANASDGTSIARATARMIYQEYVPHYALPAGEGDVPIYQAFTVGRVRFIMTDLRSNRSPVNQEDDGLKTMMGGGQKAWFKQELLAAKDKYPLIFWVSTVPWLGVAGTNYYPISTNYAGFVHHLRLPLESLLTGRRQPGREDHWSMYATERQEIANFVKEHWIRGMCILHGDAHMLGADDGRHGDFAAGGVRIPVLAAAPLDQASSIKGGPYSHGVYVPRRGEGCFGLVQVMDATNSIKVVYSGRNHLNQEKVGLRFEIPAFLSCDQ